MSIMAAIDLAVLLQLVQERTGQHYQDYRRTMQGGLTATPPGLDYDAAGMQKFLQSVSRRLRFDTPVLIYDWTKTDVSKCLAADRDQLIELIARDTTIAAGSGQ